MRSKNLQKIIANLQWGGGNGKMKTKWEGRFFSNTGHLLFTRVMTHELNYTDFRYFKLIFWQN